MILITGASASGKTETAKELGVLYGVRKVVTHTTRDKRVGEVDGIDYHFVTKEEFIQLKNLDAFVETTVYNNNYYGTSKKEIADDKVLVVETSGARVFLGLNDDHIMVYRLHASNDTRAERMRNRGDKEADIQKRLINDITRFADDRLQDERIFEIDTEKYNIRQVAEIIYKHYTDYLDQVKNK